MTWLTRAFSMILRVAEKPQDMWNELVGVFVQKLFRAVLGMTVDASLSFRACRVAPSQTIAVRKYQLVLGVWHFLSADS